MARARNKGSRRKSPQLILVALLAVLAVVITSCSSSKKSTTSSSSPGSTSSTGIAKASDVGITATQIKIGVIADVNTSVQPGLFQKSVNVVKAWADLINAKGGLAGRQVVVDFCDSKLDSATTTNCVINACANDFAMVGTAALAVTDLNDIDGCKNAQGQAVGISNLAGIAFPPALCDKNTWVQNGPGTYCATANQKPQTYTLNVGDFRYYNQTFPDLHGIWVYDSDVPSARITQLPAYQMGSNFGIKKDGQGFYTSSASAPQSALTPTVLVLKSNKSTFAFNGTSPFSMAAERKEAALQGVSTVKVWACNSGCYDSQFLAVGGSSVEGTYMPVFNLPFYNEYQDNPALSALVDKLGGVTNVNNNALASYISSLLFQDAVTKAVANGGTLNRQTLSAALGNEHSFDAQGIIGATDVGSRTPSPCIVIEQVVNGAFKRVFPTKEGTFDCAPANVGQIKLDSTG